MCILILIIKDLRDSWAGHRGLSLRRPAACGGGSPHWPLPGCPPGRTDQLRLREVLRGLLPANAGAALRRPGRRGFRQNPNELRIFPAALRLSGVATSLLSPLLLPGATHRFWAGKGAARLHLRRRSLPAVSDGHRLRLVMRHFKRIQPAGAGEHRVGLREAGGEGL